jgi:hypothetical protein
MRQGLNPVRVDTAISRRHRFSATLSSFMNLKALKIFQNETRLWLDEANQIRNNSRF